MRIFGAILTACLLLSSCGGDSERQSTRSNRGKDAAATAMQAGAPAVKTKRLDFASCFAEDLTDEAAKSSRCPSFALLALDYMNHECSAAGGALKPLAQSVAWSLDVDGDASAEMLVDLAENIDCEGVPGVFSCGSLGCPFILYKKRGETWVELGAINADDAPGIEVLPSAEGSYASLRGGCTGLQPCSEYTYYEWNGSAYVRTWIDFKGHPVDFKPGGLMTLTQDAALLDAPGKRGQMLDEYPVGTTVVVIGNARDAPYAFVSPCNACRRGFVETGFLKK
jgi:hypothetical protein